MLSMVNYTKETKDGKNRNSIKSNKPLYSLSQEPLLNAIIYKYMSYDRP